MLHGRLLKSCLESIQHVAVGDAAPGFCSRDVSAYPAARSDGAVQWSANKAAGSDFSFKAQERIS